MGHDALGDRMKTYEQAEAGRKLMPLLPIMVRVDGRSFSNFTRDLVRPFDNQMHQLMVDTTAFLVKETNARVGYTQSDEISLILYSDNYNSQLYFDGKIHKLVSQIAAQATVFFAKNMGKYLPPEKADSIATFDCRVWNVPNKMEAANTIIWREIDAVKNSISMLARYHFSHKDLQDKSCDDMLKMLADIHVDWSEYPAGFRKGTYVQRKTILTKFSNEELANLPPQHAARHNPNFQVERSVIAAVANMPRLNTITNVVDVLFDGAHYL